jgi:hypothetical protein
MRLILWNFCSNSLIMRVVFSSVFAALSDPESDNHQKNQPKNHGWICLVATETRLEISVSWSSRTTRNSTVRASSRFRNPTVRASSAGPLKRGIVPSDKRTHTRTHTHVVIIYKMSIMLWLSKTINEIHTTWLYYITL